MQTFVHPWVRRFLVLWVSLQRPQTRHACTEPRSIGTCNLGNEHFLGLAPNGFLYTGPSPWVALRASFCVTLSAL